MRIAWAAAVAGALALGCMTNTGRRAWNVPKGELEPTFGLQGQVVSAEPGEQAVAGTASVAYGVTDRFEVGAGAEVDAFYSTGGELGKGVKPWVAGRVWVKQNLWAKEDGSAVWSLLATGSYHALSGSAEVAALFGARLSERVELTLSPRLMFFTAPTPVGIAGSAAVGVRVTEHLRVMPELAVISLPYPPPGGWSPAVQGGVSFVFSP